MKLAIIGSRGFKNYQFLSKTIKDMMSKNGWIVDEIVSGGAGGADTLAWEYATVNRIKLVEYKPDWNAFGKRAGMIRNADIIKHADVIIAFHDMSSPGTAGAIQLGLEANKPVHVINVREVIDADLMEKKALSSKSI